MLARYHGIEVATAGDRFLATFDGPGRCACAESIIEALAAIDITVRAGVHTGEVERMGDNIGGMAVHIGSRVGALAGAAEAFLPTPCRGGR